MAKLTIKIQGYGKVVVKIPKKVTKKKLKKAVATAVAQTMQLVDPQIVKKKFDMTYGFRDYGS